jgi:hypothetical protein
MPSKMELEVVAARQEAQILRLQQQLSDVHAALGASQANLSEAFGTIEANKDTIKSMTASYAALRGERETALVAKQAAEKARDATLGEFADLKARVANLGAENERLRGYIDRVREDDSVKDPPLVMHDTTERTAPRRQPAPDIAHPLRTVGDVTRTDAELRHPRAHELSNARDGVGQVRRHWTSYGQG